MAAIVVVPAGADTPTGLAPGPEVDAILHPIAAPDDAAAGGWGARPLTEAEVRMVLRAAGWEGERLDEAVRVAWCESRWSPSAVGDGGASRGMMQLWTGWFAWAGEDVARWSDPVVSARVARRVLERDEAMGRDGWAQWTCRP